MLKGRVVTAGSSEEATVGSSGRMSLSGCTSACPAVWSAGVSAVGEYSVWGPEVGLGWRET